MSYETHLLDDKKDKSWLSFIFKIVFFLCALFLVMITVLANMGGNGDAWKESLETFVSSVAGNKPAKVGVLNQMRFFPRMGFDAESIEIYHDEENLFPLVTIKKAQMYIKFWNVAFGNSRFSHVYIEDLKALKGVIGREEVWVERLFVDHDIEAKAAFLRANGKIGVHPWSLDAALDISGSKGDYTFKFPENFPVHIELADMRLEAKVTRHEDAYLKIDDFKITKGAQEITGDFVLSSAGRNLLKVRGGISDGMQENNLKFDLLVDSARRPMKFIGPVRSEKLSLGVLDKTHDFLSLYNSMRDIFGYDEVGYFTVEDTDLLFGGYDLDLEFDLKNVDLKEDQAQDVSFSMIQEAGKYHIGGVTTAQEKMLLPPIASVFDDTQKRIILVFKGKRDDAFVKNIGLDKTLFDQEGCSIITPDGVGGDVLLPKASYDFLSSFFQGEYAESKCKSEFVLLEPPEEKAGSLETLEAPE